jgi:hypothetical protein
MILLKLSLKKLEKCGLEPFWPGQWPMSGYCENVNEPVGFVTGGKFLE